MIERLQAKESKAFDELISLYKQSVFNTCYRFMLNKEDAEDLSQDVFVEVFQSMDRFRGDAKLSTWIYRITVSKCLDELKKRNRKKRLASFGKLLHLDSVAHWIAGGAMPDKELQDEDRMKEIAKVLDRLPENQRVAFTLSKVEGFTNTEIAEIMHTTTVAVESLIYRAKRETATELTKILRK